MPRDNMEDDGERRDSERHYRGWTVGCNWQSVIIGAIVVAVVIMLFFWLLPTIGFILTAALCIGVVLLVAFLIIWLLRSAFGAGRRYRR